MYPYFRYDLRWLHNPDTIGKDEVSSSNLDSSSKKLLKSLDFRSFCFIFPQNNVGRKVGQAG